MVDLSPQKPPKSKRISSTAVVIYFSRWQVGSWGACSASCELGDQIQDVFCEAVYDDGTSKVVDDEQCLSLYQAKPQYRRSCNDGVPCDRPSYKWTSSDWRQVIDYVFVVCSN